MGKVKKIALITCGSNFERHKRVVHEVHETLKEMGGTHFMYLQIMVFS